ncbi:hypothetical protein [Sodalis glossinidius]|uniref:hypothetical protein n=1 Tax=Sodalis glossinidius TaxID=63612 RepID=UPI0002EC7A87|nr:hypothetical protein [Sodalis glossinidius]
MSLKGELAKWKALAEGQEWLLEDEKDFKNKFWISMKKAWQRNHQHMRYWQTS